ncbi:unnamed protein product [Triticum turgidum subsp. durum]|uniref:Uncharacterized protein n=1 Tax=Triticum turgidum subsp. durum TaxID=4567 RepID=A0A9R1QPP0_TRITD|nr:unnamed protein product [Triticum turgidum subsp. durum]
MASCLSPEQREKRKRDGDDDAMDRGAGRALPMLVLRRTPPGTWWLTLRRSCSSDCRASLTHQPTSPSCSVYCATPLTEFQSLYIICYLYICTTLCVAFF